MDQFDEHTEWNKNHPLYWQDEYDFYGADAAADYIHWSKAPYWTAEEGTALSYGNNPRIMNWAFLSGFYPWHPQAMHYHDRLDLVIRAQKLKTLPNLIEPAEFIRWARSIRIEFPSELETAVGQLRSEEVRDWQAEYQALAQERDTLAAKNDAFERAAHEPLLETERRAMLTMIAAMAWCGYKFVPTGNSTVPQEIVGDVVKVGLSLDVKTVRKYLQSSAKLIPPEYTNNR